jgi:hypothetical protein
MSFVFRQFCNNQPLNRRFTTHDIVTIEGAVVPNVNGREIARAD